jgi:alcohol sulfotransferase
MSAALPIHTRLSHDLRLRWKIFKRSHKRLRFFRRADVVLVAYAKSGRTWLSVMISQLVHRKFGTPAEVLISTSDFRRDYPHLLQFFLTADDFAPRGMTEQAKLKLYKTRKVILLVRDPRDVAVSLYFQLSKRAPPVERAIYQAPDNLESMALFDFVCDEHIGLPRIIDWLNGWEARINEIPQSLMLSYEELRADTPRVLGEVARFVGWDCSAEEIAAAVDFASFDRLKGLERQHFFRSDRMRPGDTADPNSYKVRRGKVGGYQDYFSPEQLAEIDALVAARLSPTLGYSEPSAAGGASSTG